MLGIVRGHGGAIVVSSVPGQGSTIRVLFPIAAGGDGEAAAATRVDPLDQLPGKGRGRPGTILVVDDEEAVRSLVRRMLERLGFAVLEAADGAEAESVFRDHHQALAGVVLDLSMPRVDGVEALARLRAIQPSARVILASGFDRDDSLRRFTSERPTTFIHKPFRFSQLRAVLADVLDTALDT